MQFNKFEIRPLAAGDLNEYFRLVETNRKRLENFFVGTTSRTKTIEETEVFLSEIIKKAENKIYFPFIIVDTENKSFAGFIDVKNIDWNIPKAEIGFYIDKNYENKGITKKAISILTDYCFGHYQFKKIFLRTHQSNIAAQKVAEHGGFELEGTIRRDYKTTAGELVDLLYYGRLSDQDPR